MSLSLFILAVEGGAGAGRGTEECGWEEPNIPLLFQKYLRPEDPGLYIEELSSLPHIFYNDAQNRPIQVLNVSSFFFDDVYPLLLNHCHCS